MLGKKILVIGLLATGALALAGIGLVVRHTGRTPVATARAAASPTATPAGDPNVVIRFVKNPEMAPAFTAQDLSGKPVSKADWSGKVVMVNFWATWCPPCREEIPEMIELKKSYGDRLEIVGISEDDDPPQKVLEYAQKQGMNYPVVMATPELIHSFGGVPALPTTFLIDTEGRVVQKHTGLYPIASYHTEIRSLLGLPTNGRIETFVDTGQVFLKNAVNATELPGVDFKGLNEDQKKVALHRMNAESCTCGCKLTVSQCRVNDSECPVSMKIAAQIVQDAAHGNPAALPPAGAQPITQ